MTIVRVFLALVLIFEVTLSAKSLVEGNLKSGKTIVLTPQNNSALTITCERGANSSFDFIMKNNDLVVYEEKQTSDNMYLIFHDNVYAGDSITLVAHGGSIKYKIDRIDSLPEVVKNVLTPKETQKETQTKSETTATVAQETVQAPANVKTAEKSSDEDLFYDKFTTVLTTVLRTDEDKKSFEEKLASQASTATMQNTQVASQKPLEENLPQQVTAPKIDNTKVAPIVFSDMEDDETERQTTVSAPSVDTNLPPVVATNNAVQTKTKNLSPSYNPDSRYQEKYKSLDKNAPQLSKPVELERTFNQRKKPVTVDDEEETMVVTKTIDKPKVPKDPYAGRALGPMDDRVLGTGVSDTAYTGRLGMRASKNKKPIAAWVEVFKNGTKQRVKTFYTSKSAQTKHVKLPAGVYMVRVSYRTKDSKQQKTLKTLHINAGDTIDKSLVFNDGKLKVIAQRAGRPLYVKVLVYKHNARKRVTYGFSSRTTGISEITLSNGVYDIEVLDHDDVLPFDTIRISGGKTNTINVDF